MKNFMYPLAITAALAASACNNSANNNNEHSDTTSMATTAPSTADGMQTAMADTAFANKAAIGGMAEVELSQLAKEKASDAKVKEFAAMMVEHHTKINDELKSTAQSKNMMLPTSLDAEHQKIKDDLMKKEGKEFDKAYVEAMVDGHEKTHDLMEDGAKNNQDPELKAFAAKTEPVVEDHLAMIKKIHADMK